MRTTRATAERSDRGPAEGWRKAVKTKATLIPVALIVGLATILGAHQMTARWDEWTGSDGRARQLAELVPDEADAVVLINTKALAKPGRSDTLNNFRKRATEAGGKDVTEWLGENSPVDEDTLKKYRATKLAWMKLADDKGQGIIVRVAGNEQTDGIAEEATENNWMRRTGDGTIAWATASDTLDIVGQFEREKSIATTEDFRRVLTALEGTNMVIAFISRRVLEEGSHKGNDSDKPAAKATSEGGTARPHRADADGAPSGKELGTEQLATENSVGDEAGAGGSTAVVLSTPRV